jgi:hypothetical protein
VTALWLGVSIASVWYLPRFDFVYHVLGFGYGARSDAPDLSHFSAYTYYPKALVREELSWPFTLVFIVLVTLTLVFWTLGRLKVSANGWILASWLIVPLAVTTLSTHRDARAIMPVLPSVALILAWGLSAVPERAVRGALLSICLPREITSNGPTRGSTTAGTG